MNKQIIYEIKTKLINFAFQTPTNSNPENILNSIMVFNDFHDTISGTISLIKSDVYETKSIGELNTEYSFIQIVSTYPILINFAVGEVITDLKTSNFMYSNIEEKIKNISISNYTLQTANPRDINIKYLIIDVFDHNYTTFGDYYGF